jgi:glutamate-ammonia-ligase adenylyltransferase
MIAPPALPAILAADAERKAARLLEALAPEGVSPPAALPPWLVRVLALSDFVAEALARSPELAAGMLSLPDGPPARPRSELDAALAAEVAGAEEAGELGRRLRRFRRREMVRIASRDLLGLCGFEETVADLSALAEAAIGQALEWLYRRLAAETGPPAGEGGRPQRLVVLGLGKLGAGELNFSSDVDLIFAYPGGGPDPAAAEAFFTRLCRQLVRAIGEATAEGFVFRVDLRLRPFGENGPLAMSFDALEHYYQEQGRDWERYAWIKARAVAGDLAAGAQLLGRLKPFVYRRYLDFGAFESLRAMKQMIAREVARRGLDGDIKLGAGGIREIEFFGQIFQLIRGGVSPPLQGRRIREVLGALAREGHIDPAAARELDRAYLFLRTVEHRLQEAGDQQTHELPRDALGCARLAAGLGFAGYPEFLEALAEHRRAVHGHFRMLLETPEEARAAGDAAPGLASAWLNLGDEAESLGALAGLGFAPAAEARRLLAELLADPETRALSATGRQRLDRLVPLVLRETAAAAQPLETLRRTLDLIRAVERRTSYLALLLEYPAALRRLVALVAASPWIASFLARHPVLLDELLDPRSLARPPGREELAQELARRFRQAPAGDLECQIEELCIFKQVNVFRVAAADVGGRLPLMRVSDHLSDIAETVIREVVALAWEHLAEKHGEPSFGPENGGPRGFTVIAYGKLGGLELGYASDLDLVFLHAGREGQTVGGPRPIDHAQFFNRLGQRVIHLLTAHTRAGRPYEIDTRLRPSGISGVLVQPLAAFRDYLLREAWTWEHQALIKARPVSGEPALAARFEAVRGEVLRRRRDRRRLRAEVAEMRERMRRERLRGDPGSFDLKEGRGGIVDIEFLVQYLTLAYAHRVPELARWTDTVRLIRTLIESGVLHEVTGHILKHAYLIYRAAAHQLSLQEKPARVPRETFARLKPRIEHIWRAVMAPGADAAPRPDK